MRHIFIINNVVGAGDVSHDVRAYLKMRTDIESLVFDTEYAGHETKLAAQMCEVFDDEQIRFYVCGGSGTFANVLAGIQDMEHTEIAFYPTGISCDILKCFKGGAAAFRHLDRLIDGSAIQLDYIDGGAKKALNTFSAGLDGEVVKWMDFFRPLSRIHESWAYQMAAFVAFFVRKSFKASVTVDGQVFDGKYLWVYMGNGNCCGGAFRPIKGARPDDGTADIFLLERLSIRESARLMLEMQKGDTRLLPRYAEVLQGHHVTISIQGKNPCVFDYDGDIYMEREAKLQLITGGIRFVVPEGTELKSFDGI